MSLMTSFDRLTEERSFFVGHIAYSDFKSNGALYVNGIIFSINLPAGLVKVEKI